jgi:hypothetical protein
LDFGNNPLALGHGAGGSQWSSMIITVLEHGFHELSPTSQTKGMTTIHAHHILFGKAFVKTNETGAIRWGPFFWMVPWYFLVDQ